LNKCFKIKLEKDKSKKLCSEDLITKMTNKLILKTTLKEKVYPRIIKDKIL
jgi:hypothetical protein